MTEFDTLIKGGTVIDGTGAPRQNADKFGTSARGKHAAQPHSARVAGGVRAFSASLRSPGVVEAPIWRASSRRIARLRREGPRAADELARVLHPVQPTGPRRPGE
jgi:hypothetical protein